MMHIVTSSKNLTRFMQKASPWIVAIGLLSASCGLVLGLFLSSPDTQQGEVVRIMYVHVPASWGAVSLYTAMAVMGGGAFIMRAPMLHFGLKAMAPVGATLTLISLVTGAIWGKPTWGAWWVWDARLTSMLVLFFLYVGYMRLVSSFEDTEKGLMAGALLVVIGAINIPIIKWSVEWWHTLHQPAGILRFAKPAVHSDFLWPLGLMTLAFMAFSVLMIFLRIQTQLNDQRWLKQSLQAASSRKNEGFQRKPRKRVRGGG